MSKKIFNPKLAEKIDRITKAREADRVRSYMITTMLRHCQRVVAAQDDFHREAFTDDQLVLLTRLRNTLIELIGDDVVSRQIGIDATDPDMKT